MTHRLTYNNKKLISGFVLILLMSSLSYTETQNGYSSFCSKGEVLLKENKSDSALFYFSQAFENGMPQDSFYFFWAEVYLNKGSADSAFVLNYSIKLPVDTSFKSKVLEQRYIIYTTLGWSDKAKAVFDTLSSYITVDKKGFWKIFLPSLSFRSGGIFGTSKENQQGYPFPPGMDTSVIEPDFKGQLGARWALPVYKNIIFSPGIEYSIRNAGHENVSRDSIGKNLSLSGEISFGNLFNIDYTWRRSNLKSGQIDFMNDFSISKIMGAEKWDAILFGDFSLLNSLNQGYSGKYGTFFAFFDRQLHNKHTISSSFFAVAQWLKPDTLNFKIPVMYVDDVTKPSGKVVHYYKDSLSKPIPSDDPTQTLPDYISNIVDTLNLHQIIPSTSYNFSSTFNYQIPIFWKMNVSFSFEYSLLWYPQAYKWWSFSSDIPMDIWNDIYSLNLLWSAYNKKDGECYAAKKPSAVSGGIEDVFSTGPISSKEQIRIDNTLAFSIGLGKYLNRFGSLSSYVKVWKNFSTLPKDAPVRIPDYGLTVSLDYSVNVSF